MHPAICACDANWSISHGALNQLIATETNRLLAAGVTRNDRVGICIENAPELAMSLLAVMSIAQAAPFNPGGSAEAIRKNMILLGTRFLICDESHLNDLAPVCEELEITIIIARSLRSGIPSEGLWRPLPVISDPGSMPSTERALSDLVLLLQTSGTTSVPKTVPLSLAQIVSASAAIANSYELTKRDTCLTLMPLFHIHGIVASFLTPLRIGATVIIPDSFNAQSVPQWLQMYEPSWYTAVPTMHQAIARSLESVGYNHQTSSLRFVRSASAKLPATLHQQLTELLNVPVLEAYGMTEACHHISTNGLHPDKQKPGSVGNTTSFSVKVVSDTLQQLGCGQEGQVLIKGPQLMTGYEHPDSSANTGITDGWLNTRDLGYIDELGYLFLTGRLDEIINRAGEKINPFDVDQVLHSNPKIEQAVAFPSAHATMGQDLHAAVVLNAAEESTEAQLREFCFDRLPAYMVPTCIFILEFLPRSPTGKIVRKTLDTVINATAANDDSMTDLERQLAAIFQNVVKCSDINKKSNFFVLGGDSLSGMQVVNRINDQLKIKLKPTALFFYPTVESLANEISTKLAS